MLFCPVAVKIKVLPANGPFPDPKDFTSVPGTLKNVFTMVACAHLRLG